MGSVDIRFRQIDAATATQILSETTQEPIQNTGFHPMLKSSVTRRRWRVPTRDVRPRRSSTKHPQHSVENGACRRERSTAATSAAQPLVSRNEILDRLPLFVRQIHLDV
jgi:hypothetical protein